MLYAMAFSFQKDKIDFFEIADFPAGIYSFQFNYSNQMPFGQQRKFMIYSKLRILGIIADLDGFSGSKPKFAFLLLN